MAGNPKRNIEHSRAVDVATDDHSSLHDNTCFCGTTTMNGNDLFPKRNWESIRLNGVRVAGVGSDWPIA